MSSFSTPPPPPPLTYETSGSTTPASAAAAINQIPPLPYTNTPSPSTMSSSSIVVVIIIVASAVIVSASIYLLLRLLSKRFHRSFRTFAAADDVILHHDSNPNLNQCHVPSNNLVDSLPLFTFGSVTGNLTGVDCAVCLSKFEPLDQLRLLPLCCHAFHASCIDTWLLSNQTCPLCRSSVIPSEPEILNKIFVETGRSNDIISNNFDSLSGSENGGSFRIEMGSISRRRGGEDTGGRRSYSIGSFEYIVDNGYEVSVGSTTTHRRGASDCTSVDKESSIGVPVAEPPPGDVLAGEVSRGRNWLREYVDRLASISVSSRSISFRSSGRFFTGSSRRSDTVVPVEDLEANRVGEEISELFRWLSGV